MRRAVFVTLGLLEVAAALVLVGFGWQLPRSGDIDGAFGRAERVTRRTGGQVRALRRQVGELRRPEVKQLADQLKEQTQATAATLKAQRVDFDQVRAVRGAMGDVASGLDGFSDA